MEQVLNLAEDLDKEREYQRRLEEADEIINLENDTLVEEIYKNYINGKSLEEISEDVFDDNWQVYIDSVDFMLDTARENKANGTNIGDYTCTQPKPFCKRINSCRDCEMYDDCIAEFEEYLSYSYDFMQSFVPEEVYVYRVFEAFIARGYYFRIENEDEVDNIFYEQGYANANFDSHTLNVIKAKMTLAKEENKSCYIEVNSPQTILMPEVFLNTGDNILQYGNNYMYIRKEDYRYANINN